MFAVVLQDSNSVSLLLEYNFVSACAFCLQIRSTLRLALVLSLVR